MIYKRMRGGRKVEKLKRITNKTFLLSLMAYVIVVAVTLGLSFGWHYKKADQGEGYSADAGSGATPSGTADGGNDAVAAATPLGEEGSTPDGVTAASPYGGSTTEVTTPDAVTGPSPVSGTDPTTNPSLPPDTVTGPSPAPAPTTDPVTPPDTVTGPSPAPAPGTTPAPEPTEEDDEEEEDEEEESFNLLLIVTLMGLMGMTSLGMGVFKWRSRKEA